MKRITIVLLGLLVGGTAACRDMGLEGNIPLEEARDRPPTPLVVAVTSPAEPAAAPLVVDGRLWVTSGMPLTMDQSDVRAIGSANGRTVHARRWDESPYDALFIVRPTARAGGGGEPAGATTGGATAAGADEWIELRPVLGRSGPVPGGAEGGPAAGSPPAPPAEGGEHVGH